MKLKLLILLFLTTCFSTNVFAANYVQSFDDVQKATYNIVCRENWTKNNMGGGSGSAIYQKPSGELVIVTALHVTEGCASAGGRSYLEVEKYKDSYTYVELKEVKVNKQYDLAIMETNDSFAAGQKVYKLSTNDLQYAQRVYTAGFPGVFRIPPTLIMTSGVVNAPKAKVIGCAMTDSNINRFEKKREFFQDIIGYKIDVLSVWDCDRSTNVLDTKIIDLVIHDADIGPGNSGGTLFNENFELVGVTVVGYKLMNWRPGSISVDHVKETLLLTIYADAILGNG